MATDVRALNSSRDHSLLRNHSPSGVRRVRAMRVAGEFCARRYLHLLLLVATVFAIQGCIYRHTTAPLTTEFSYTPAMASGEGDLQVGTGSTKHISVRVDILWDKNGLGDIAKEHGLQEVYFADLETEAFLGYFTQRTVHIYGR